jgi:predicted esterase
MTHPHLTQPVLAAGATLESARAAMIMIHGRGATAESILGLSQEFTTPNVAYLAPQAAGNTWYPNRFLAPTASNEPHLSAALEMVGNLVAHVQSIGIPAERTFLLGFSQGACLTLEFAARNARRYGGVIGLSGALIGPADTRRADSGSLAGTPVFLGCSDIDAHVSLPFVQRASAWLRQLGGSVTERIYPGMGHAINEDEIEFVRQLLDSVVQYQWVRD